MQPVVAPMSSARPAPTPFRGVGAVALPTMDDAQFQRWVQLLERRTGIVVPGSRREFLESNLRQRMRETGHGSFDTYYDQLLDGARGAVEWATLVDRLTVHQTHFFRHLPSFGYIRERWLPEYTTRAGWGGSVEAWSIGCASGEEAYSLAMVLDAGLRALDRKAYFGVSATDVSQPALAAGRQGLYPVAKRRELPAEYAETYLREVSAEQFAVVDSLRQRVAFSVFNLMDLDRQSLSPLDLVFCQNVLIYFGRELRVRLLDRIATLLNPGGVVILGSGEVMSYAHPLLERVDHRSVLAFRRRREP